jgi:hypothetical protein
MPYHEIEEFLQEEIKKNGRADVSRYDYFRAHLPYMPDAWTKPIVYVTMFREPIDRCVSQYKHIFRHEAHPRHALARNFGTLAGYLRNFDDPGFWNRHCMMIAGPSISQSQLLEVAKKNLASFPFFGIQERFEESIELLAYIFDKGAPVIVSQNVSPDDLQVEITDEVLAILNEKNQLDLKLYQYALEEFDACYKKMRSFQ